jgi:hypothetical protein
VSEIVALDALDAAGVPVDVLDLVPAGVALWLVFLAFAVIDSVQAVRVGEARPPSGVILAFPAIALVALVAALVT